MNKQKPKMKIIMQNKKLKQKNANNTITENQPEPNQQKQPAKAQQLSHLNKQKK